MKNRDRATSKLKTRTCSCSCCGSFLRGLVIVVPPLETRPTMVETSVARCISTYGYCIFLLYQRRAGGGVPSSVASSCSVPLGVFCFALGWCIYLEEEDQEVLSFLLFSKNFTQEFVSILLYSSAEQSATNEHFPYTKNIEGGPCLPCTIVLPLVRNTRYTLDVIKNLHRGIPKPEKNHTGPFSIHKCT